MTLLEVKEGETVAIEQIQTSLKIKKRLHDMGILEGLKITVIKNSRFFGQIEFKARDFYITLRLSDAKNISVNIIDK